MLFRFIGPSSLSSGAWSFQRTPAPWALLSRLSHARTIMSAMYPISEIFTSLWVPNGELEKAKTCIHRPVWLPFEDMKNNGLFSTQTQIGGWMPPHNNKGLHMYKPLAAYYEQCTYGSIHVVAHDARTHVCIHEKVGFCQRKQKRWMN